LPVVLNRHSRKSGDPEEEVGFPRIKSGAGLVKPGMTTMAKRFTIPYARIYCFKLSLRPRINLKILPFLTLALAVLTATEGRAFYESIGAKSVGMGGAFRAMADDNSAIFFNPAGLTQTKRYTVGTGYTLVNSGSENFHYLSGSIVDTKTSPVGAGVAYIYKKRDRDYDQQTEAQEVAVALAQEYLRSFHLGVTTHYLWPHRKGWRLDASALFIPSHYIIFGVIGKNLVHVKGDQREVDFGLGSRLGEYVNLDFDLLWLPKAKSDNLGYNLGIELVARKEIFIRGGYSFDRSDRDWYGLGLGWRMPRGSFEYAFRREVGGSDVTGHWLEIAVSI